MKHPFLFILLAGPLLSQNLSLPDPLQTTFQWTADGDSIWVLPKGLFIPGTFHVRLDSVPLFEGRDYRFDGSNSRLVFIIPPDSGRTLFINYRPVPLFFKPVYRRWADSTVSTEPGIPFRRTAPPAVSAFDETDGLDKSGSIFRGVSVGTGQGMRLESGLRLQVSGRLSKDVELTASLTDQSTPIQPEGNTQTLQEIDKIFVNLRSPRFDATMGDYVFSVTGLEFGSYERKLQGGMATYKSPSGFLTLSAASTRGEFTTNKFTGQEGNQGPYQLVGSSGQREIIVLAGTEKVYIDGEAMTRGEDNDYTIDYSSGQVLFTRKRLVTSDSRITVDFEYSDLKYPKGIYGASGEWRFGKRLALRAALVREADDPSNPLDSPLTEEEKSVLSRAGDNPDSAAASGAMNVGANLGDYVRETVSGVTIYRWAGTRQGDYTVRFTYVGFGKGDYELQSFGVCRYVGPGLGAYLPVVYLPRPKRHQSATMASSFLLGKGVTFNGEFAVSDLDLNRFSSIDDKDNTGRAYSASLKMDERPIRIAGMELGSVRLGLRARETDDRFMPVGRTTDIEHERKWALPGVSSGEAIREFNAAYSPWKGSQILGEYGSLRTGAGFQSIRRMIDAKMESVESVRFGYRAEHIASRSPSNPDGYWFRQNGTMRLSRWGFSPFLTYSGEDRRDAAADSVYGFKFDEWTAGVGFTRRGMNGEYAKTLRSEDSRGSAGLVPQSKARTDRIRMDWRPGTGYGVALGFTHRTRDWAVAETADQRSDLADFRFQFAPASRLIEGTFDYQFSSTQSAQLVRDTLQVGRGLGNYRFDESLGELVPDADGDLIVRLLQTGRYQPVNQLKAGLEFEVNASRLNRPKGWVRFLSLWTSRTSMRIEREDKERDFSTVNRSAVHPRWGNDSTVVLTLMSFQQDFECRADRLSLRLRFRKDDSENHELDDLIRHAWETGFLGKVNPNRSLGFSLEYQRMGDAKRYLLRAISRDIVSSNWSVEASVRPKQAFEIALKGRIRQSRDTHPVPASEATGLFLAPRVVWSFSGKGQVRVELETGRVSATPEGRALPYEMLAGDQPGRIFRGTLMGSYRVSNHVMATLNWRLRKDPWRAMIQTGQIEMRAFF